MAGICGERFAAVIQKKRDNNLEIHKSRPAIVGSGHDSSRLFVISKKTKLKSIFISRISPHISGSDSENFMYGYLNCHYLLAPSFNKIYYSHLYVSVTQVKFPLENKDGALPISAIIFERLRPDHV